jgi:hypothetical protein
MTFADREEGSDMKTIFFVAGILLAACGMSFGQSGGVSLQNQENATFYYVVDPKELAGLSAGSPLLASRIAGYFAARDDFSFSSLPPNASVRLDGLTDGTHLLVGFFEVKDLSEFPVRVISLQADSGIGDRFYVIFASPALLSVARDSGRLAGLSGAGGVPLAAEQPGGADAASGPPASQVEIATLPVAIALLPVGLQPIATFSTAFTPAFFTREKQGEFSVLPIAESRAWALTGTRIEAISGSLSGGVLKLSLTVAGGFTERVSYFLYVFGSRAPGKDNQFTLELQPGAEGARAVCLLWRKGASTPTIVGDVAETDTTVELDATAGQFPPDLIAGIGVTATVDITTGWFDRGLRTWEEFYYTTFSIGDVPVTR